MRHLALCLALGLCGAFAQDSRPAHEPAKKAQPLSKTLKETQLALSADGQPLSETLEFLRMAAKLNVVLAPGVDRDAEVTINEDDSSLKDLLDAIGSAVKPKLSWSIVDGAVVHLHPADAKAPKTPKVDKAWTGEHGRRKVSVNFPDGVSLSEATEFFNALYGIAFDEGEFGEAELSLSLQDVPLPTALTLIAEHVGASWTVEDGTVKFMPPKTKSK